MRRVLIPAILVLGALSLAGCTTASGGSSDSRGSATQLRGEQAPAVKGAADSAGDKSVASGERQVIKSGSITITVKSPTRAADEVSRIADSAGGRVDNRQEQAADDEGDGSASLTVRVPSAKLSATIDRLKKLGKTETVAVSSDDVTTEAQDLKARISALHTSVDRLQSLMAKATSTQDLIAIETALSERQANLESLEAQDRQLKDQVDLSTLTVNLNSTATTKAQLPGNFLDGLITGWQSLIVFFGGLVVVVGVLLPWIVLAAIVAAAVLILIRLRRKRTVKRGDAAS